MQLPIVNVNDSGNELVITINRAGLRNIMSCLAMIAGGEDSSCSMVFADSKEYPHAHSMVFVMNDDLANQIVETNKELH